MTIPDAAMLLRLHERHVKDLQVARAIRLAVNALEIVGAMCEQISEDLLREIEE